MMNGSLNYLCHLAFDGIDAMQTNQPLTASSLRSSILETRLFIRLVPGLLLALGIGAYLPRYIGTMFPNSPENPFYPPDILITVSFLAVICICSIYARRKATPFLVLNFFTLCFFIWTVTLGNQPFYIEGILTISGSIWLTFLLWTKYIRFADIGSKSAVATTS